MNLEKAYDGVPQEVVYGMVGFKEVTLDVAADYKKTYNVAAQSGQNCDMKQKIFNDYRLYQACILSLSHLIPYMDVMDVLTADTKRIPWCTLNNQN